jgi:plastocyanin
MAIEGTYSRTAVAGAAGTGSGNPRSTAMWLVPAAAIVEVLITIEVQRNVGLIPPLLVFGVLLAALALVNVVRPRGWTYLAGGIILALFTASNAPIIIDGLLHPVATSHQWDELVALFTGIAGSVAGVAAFVETRRPARLRPAFSSPMGEALAIGLVGALVGASYIGLAAYREVQASPGAGVVNGVQSAPTQAPIQLAAQGSVYQQKALELRTGSGTVYVVNHDAAPHTFDMDLGGRHYSYPIPANSTVGVVLNFTAAGRYTYWCAIAGHRANGMDGTLTVSPS